MKVTELNQREAAMEEEITVPKGSALEDLKKQDLSLQGVEELSCLLYTSPSPRDGLLSRMPSSA